MGVKIHTSLPLAETSVRSDMALAIIKKITRYFDQLLVVGDPYFIKRLVEEGIEEKIDWTKLNSSFIFGEDWFSESFRTYIENQTGIKAQTRILELRPGELTKSWGVYDKAKKILGFEPRINIENGAEEMMQWVKGAHEEILRVYKLL